MVAELVYIHTDGPSDIAIRRAHLLDMYLTGALQSTGGCFFPEEYHIHFSEVDIEQRSLNLHVTNGGCEIDPEKIRKILSQYKQLFGEITVGKFGTTELKTP